MEKKKAKQERSDAEIIKNFRRCINVSENCGDCPYRRTRHHCDIQRLNAEALGVMERLQKDKVALQKRVAELSNSGCADGK